MSKVNHKLTETNAKAIDNLLGFLSELISQRLSCYFNPELEAPPFEDVLGIISRNKKASFASFVDENKLGSEEIITLLMAIAPHINTAFFDQIIQQNLPQSGDFPQIGGVRGSLSRGFLPTGETVLFLLGGADLNKRFKYHFIFDDDHLFAKKGLLWLEKVGTGEPKHSGKLIMGAEYLELFVQGKSSRPKLSIEFPAEHIKTQLTDDDLVLPPETRQQIKEVENWIRYQDVLMSDWRMDRWVKPGYSALFYGPPGTGKTLAATILGRKTGRDVFRVDLSMVVSKYIGETEKNLSQLFDRADNKDWILFFDEADALFGKRTNVRDAHDKYANQEVSYLLQRIEMHNGLIILATNLKSIIDEAFFRRFQSVVYFPPPDVRYRFELWKKVLPEMNGVKVPSDSELMALSKKYAITGAGIVNVVQHCCLEALSNKHDVLSVEQLRKGVEREYMKEGKVI